MSSVHGYMPHQSTCITHVLAELTGHALQPGTWLLSSALLPAWVTSRLCCVELHHELLPSSHSGPSVSWCMTSARPCHLQRPRKHTQTSRACDLQTINSAAFVMGNAWIVSHRCGWFDNPVYWSNLIQFSCWNTVSIHGMHISCPGLASCGSVPIGWPQEKGMEIDKHAVMLMTSMLP